MVKPTTRFSGTEQSSRCGKAAFLAEWGPDEPPGIEVMLAPTRLTTAPETAASGTAVLPEPVGGGVVDWSKALAQVGDAPHVLRTIVEVFLDEERDCRRRIHDALATGNAAEVHRNAHSLKGTLGLFGADQAQEVAYRLELLAKDRALDQAGDLVRELEFQLGRITPELEDYLQQPPDLPCGRPLRPR